MHISRLCIGNRACKFLSVIRIHRILRHPSYGGLYLAARYAITSLYRQKWVFMVKLGLEKICYETLLQWGTATTQDSVAHEPHIFIKLVKHAEYCAYFLV